VIGFRDGVIPAAANALFPIRNLLQQDKKSNSFNRVINERNCRIRQNPDCLAVNRLRKDI